MRKLWVGAALNLGALGFALAVWNRLPERVVSHWGSSGSPDGWTSRGGLLITMAAIAGAMLVVLTFAPRLDPKRQNFPSHAGAYWLVANAVMSLIALMFVAVIGFNLGWPIHFNALVGAALGVLFVLIGNVMTQLRPNWIFGIRTPWTLSSDRAWRETHRLGGYGFVLVGLVILLTALIRPGIVFPVLGVGVGGVALFSVVWSYFAWRNDPDAGGKESSTAT